MVLVATTVKLKRLLAMVFGSVTVIKGMFRTSLVVKA